MEKKSHLYLITNKLNGKIYFGITTLNPPTKRWIAHRTVAKRMVTKTPLARSMKKNGFEHFDFEVLYSDHNLNTIENMEIQCIKHLETQNLKIGYNLADGGSINRGFKRSESSKKQQSEKMFGNGNHFFGRKHSEETKRMISESKKGFKASEETKAKMRLRIGIWNGVTGENHPSYGTFKSQELRKQIAKNQPHRKEVLMIDSETENIIKRFESKKEAGRWLFDNNHCTSKNPRSVASTINRSIRVNSIAYGFKWREIDERQSTIETVEIHGVE